MTARYMSAIQSAPSGPVLSIVGRNQLSLDARNSRSDSFGPRRRETSLPLGLEHDPMHQVVHRLADKKARGRTTGPNSSSR